MTCVRETSPNFALAGRERGVDATLAEHTVDALRRLRTVRQH